MKKLLLMATFLVLAIPAGFHVLGPVMLEKVLVSRMAAQGLKQPRVQVLKLGLRQVHLFFHPARLVQGRVDHVLISGLSLHRDAAAGFGAADSPSSGRGQKTFLPGLFYNSLEIKSAAIHIQAWGQRMTLPFSARIQTEKPGQASLKGWTWVLGLPVTLQGRALLEQKKQQVHLTARAESKGMSREPGLDSDLEPGPGFMAEAALTWRVNAQGAGSGNIAVQARAAGLDLPGAAAGLEQGYFSAAADLDSSFQVNQARAGLDLAGLRLEDLLLDSVNIKLRENLSRVRGNVSVAAPVKALFELEGGQTGLEQIMAGTRFLQGRYQWQASLNSDFKTLHLPVQAGPGPGTSLELKSAGLLEAGADLVQESRGPAWYLAAQGEVTSPGPWSLEVPDHGLEVQGLDFVLPFEVRAEPDQAGVVLLDKAWIRISRILAEMDREKLEMQGLSIRAAREKPLLKVEKNSPGGWSAQCFLESGAPLNVSGLSGRARAENFSLQGGLKKDETSGLTGRLTARANLAEISAASPDMSLQGVRISLPVIFGPGQDENPGAFSVRQVKYAGLELPGPQGRAMVLEKQLKAGGTWSPWSGARLEFSAAAFMDAKKLPRARLEASSNWMPVPKQEMVRSLPVKAGDLTAEGDFRLDLDLQLQGLQLRPLVQLEIKDMSLGSKEMDLKVQGLSGAAEVTGLRPLVSSGSQRIEVQSLRLGQFELKQGHALFRLEPLGRIFLEKSVWQLPEGGQLTAAASSIDPVQKSADLEVFLEDVDMIRLVSRLSRGKVAGSGLVQGRIPVYYKNNQILLGDGYLHSVPGQGKLAIRDEKWLNTLLLYVREAMAGHEYLSVVTRRLEEALKDFEYDFLTLDLIPLENDVRARIELRGRGVRGDPPQEVGSLVININDLGEIVNRVLHLQLGRDESIRQTLEDLFPGEKVQ